MELSNDLMVLAVFTLPSLVVATTAYLLIKKFLQREQNLKLLDIKIANQKDTLPLRLQAYERMALYLERISPNHLLLNQYDPSMTVREFQRSLVSMIRDEFEHNLAMQIYISPALWNIIRNTKEDVVNQLNRSAMAIGPDAPAHELSEHFFNEVLANENFATQKALSILKSEVAQLF
ncbi:MAG: hypothetical protein ACKOX3_09520 [Bacteroidota bacterium]